MPACAAVAIAIISLFHVLTSDQKVYPKQKDLDMNSSCTTGIKVQTFEKDSPPPSTWPTPNICTDIPAISVFLQLNCSKFCLACEHYLNPPQEITSKQIGLW